MILHICVKLMKKNDSLFIECNVMDEDFRFHISDSDSLGVTILWNDMVDTINI